MQKKILALAVAGHVSSAAFAESNVSIYGIVDMGYASTSNNVAANATTGAAATTSKRKGIDSGVLSTSRLGFKGSEDLGGGTSALFVLEYTILADQNDTIGTPATQARRAAAGQGWSAARQQLVGLKGSFGTVVAGRANTLGAAQYNGGSNAFFGTQLDAHATISGYARANTLINAGARANNALGYISPSFSGVTVGLNYTLDPLGAEAATSGDQEKAVIFQVSYENGPMKASYVNAKLSNTTAVAAVAAPTNNGKVSASGIAISYDLKVAKIGFSTQNQKDTPATAVGGAPVANPKASSYQLSVSAPVGSGTVLGQYAKSNPGTAGAQKNNGMAVAYLHPMSKRTTAYAGYTVANDKNAAGLRRGANIKSKTWGFGIRHNF